MKNLSLIPINGEEIPNEGEKEFQGCIETIEGGVSGETEVTAQVCAVHRPLMSVKKICKN